MFADDNFIAAKLMQFLLQSVENIVGKRENDVTSILSFTHNVCKRQFFILGIGTISLSKGKNIVGKGENAVISNSPLPTMYSKAFSPRVSRIVRFW